MWSSSFTGRDSIFSDSCHRIFVEVGGNLNEKELLDICNTFCANKFFHLSISLLGEDFPTQATKWEGILQSLNKVQSIIKKNIGGYEMHAKVFTTLLVYGLSSSETFLISQCDINLIIIMKNNVISREEFVNNYLEITSAVTNVETSFGIGGIREITDLEWILNKISSGKLQVIHCGCLQLPNICSRTIELVHSWGYNAMISVVNTVEDFQSMNTFKQPPNLQLSYELPASVFFAKCMLQLGCIVGLSLQAFPPGYILQHFSRLVHPFVHRKPFVSQNKIISLAIKEEDLSEVVAASQTIEDV